MTRTVMPVTHSGGTVTGMGASTNQPPRYPLDDGPERLRFNHHIEHAHGWEYRTTSVPEADHPDGWDHMATRPEGFELNTDRWPLVDERMEDATRVSPGVIRKPKTGHLVAHWRRRVL